MVVLRLLTALLAGVATTLAVLGFAVTQSLADSRTFVADMDEALGQPQIQQELQAVIREQVLAAGDRLAQDAGPLGELARTGSSTVAEQLSASVTTDGFRSSWSQWTQLFYEGLAGSATGAPQSQVTVSGSDVTVAIGPLLEPVIGDTLAGTVSDALDLAGRDTTVTISTALPVEAGLRAAGALSNARWLWTAAALILGALAVFSGRRRVRWLSVTLLASAAGAGAVAAVLTLAQRTPAPDSQTPLLAAAVTTAVTQPWVDSLAAAALLLAGTGALALVISLFMRPGGADGGRGGVGGDLPTP